MHIIKFEVLYKNGVKEFYDCEFGYTSEQADNLTEIMENISNVLSGKYEKGNIRLPIDDSVTFISVHEVCSIKLHNVKSFAKKLIELNI